MTLYPCNDALKIFSIYPPFQWSEVISSKQRDFWLLEKKDQLKTWPKQWLTQLPKMRISKPYPDKPLFLIRQTPGSAQDIVMSYFKNTVWEQKVHQALKNQEPSYRFGVAWHKSEGRILSPPDDGSFSYLMSLAHETGHILANDGPQPDFKNVVRGESMALITEALVVKSQISGPEQSIWKKYCQLVDIYNFSFASLEFAEDLAPLRNPDFIFRESLWTMHGGQAAYALSSKIRQNLLKPWYENP